MSENYEMSYGYVDLLIDDIKIKKILTEIKQLSKKLEIALCYNDKEEIIIFSELLAKKSMHLAYQAKKT